MFSTFQEIYHYTTFLYLSTHMFVCLSILCLVQFFSRNGRTGAPRRRKFSQKEKNTYTVVKMLSIWKLWSCNSASERYNLIFESDRLDWKWKNKIRQKGQ